MRVLVACEFSGVVRDAFRALGADAVSCDTSPTDAPAGPHIRGDVLAVLDDGWDAMIAFPPCTYLTRAGARYWGDPSWAAGQARALDFVRQLWAAPIPRVAIENPYGKLWSAWRPPDQVVQPWQFGEPVQKAICLWLRGLPPLLTTWIDSSPTLHSGDPQRRQKQLGVSLPDSRGRSKRRSQTLPGVAQAMATQWTL